MSTSNVPLADLPKRGRVGKAQSNSSTFSILLDIEGLDVGSATCFLVRKENMPYIFEGELSREPPVCLANSNLILDITRLHNTAP